MAMKSFSLPTPNGESVRFLKVQAAPPSLRDKGKNVDTTLLAVLVDSSGKIYRLLET
jgi:hypothetical protein